MDTNLIPKGNYCYKPSDTPIDLSGDVPRLRIIPCPFWKATEDGAYCSHLDLHSEKYDMNLIWDQVKMCGINRDDD